MVSLLLSSLHVQLVKVAIDLCKWQGEGGALMVIDMARVSGIALLIVGQANLPF